MKSIVTKLIESWKNTSGNVNTTTKILEWINELNKTTYVEIKECSIHDSRFWFYDDYNGEISNLKRSFFSITGMRYFQNNRFVKEQPIIIQPEIGYLGIICKEIDGVINFLMQAKIEPGNVNCVQISPTIQATKSNFTRVHGGKLPAYFEYFENSNRYEILFDQIQSEQASRFYKKRNRNIIIMVDDDIEVLNNFCWMTLGQIKKLMKIDNLVNMDTRTVISGIPFIFSNLSIAEKEIIKELMNNDPLYYSIFSSDFMKDLHLLYNDINNYKMFNEIKVTKVPINELVDWKIDEYGITCQKKYDFMVRYYDISISGREVQNWTQPLFKANGSALFVLICKIIDNKLNFLVSLKPEIGSFDKLEIGPSLQIESTEISNENNSVYCFFYKKMEGKQDIILDVILSEEGGRFYHEQNRNIILMANDNELEFLPTGYHWVDYGMLNYLTQINNCLNIQLRNLISLIDF